MTSNAIDLLLKSCNLIEQRTISMGCGYAHSSDECFNICKSAFKNSRIAPEAITFRVFFSEPVSVEGRARIYRDGSMEMWTGPDEHEI